MAAVIRNVRGSFELLLLLSLAFASLASSKNDDDNGGGSAPAAPVDTYQPPTEAACEVDTDCAGYNAQDRCVGGELCQGKLCKLQPAVTCAPPTAAGQSCYDNVCEPTSWSCFLKNKPEGSACNDGDPCTTGDSCGIGVCVSGAPIQCPGSGPCVTYACSPQSGGACQATYAAEGKACDDQNACTVGEVCHGGGCAGTALTCSDGNPCTQDQCDALTGCKFGAMPNGSKCSDDTPCTTNETCQNGQCEVVYADGAACEDQNACTGNGACKSGLCVAGKAVADGTACEDNDACTTTTTCKAGVCGGGIAVTCPSDGNPCTSDVCSPGEGCQHLANLTGTPCPPIGCAAEGVCQQTKCVATGQKPDGSPCATGNECTTAGTCSQGACQGSTPLNGTACDDHNACTAGDACKSGYCQPGAAVVCDDGNVCTFDFCNPTTGCGVEVNFGQKCDDKNPCTTNDNCQTTACQGTPLCKDDNPCAVTTCDPTKPLASMCVANFATKNGAVCQVNGCTVSTCTQGECAPVVTLDCDDLSPCTADSCGQDGKCHNVYQTGGGCGVESQCTDQLDDDKNGHVDCLDGGCAGVAMSCKTSHPLPYAFDFGAAETPGFGALFPVQGTTGWSIVTKPITGDSATYTTLAFTGPNGAVIALDGWIGTSQGEGVPAQVCCADVSASPTFVSWLEWVDLRDGTPQLGRSVVLFTPEKKGFKDLPSVVLPNDATVQGHWRRVILAVPAGAATTIGVRFEVTAMTVGATPKAGDGWFVRDLRVSTAESCTNNADDNGDGLIDCKDPLCALDGACPTESSCTNGQDDDGDGLIDCQDQGCEGLTGCVP